MRRLKDHWIQILSLSFVWMLPSVVPLNAAAPTPQDVASLKRSAVDVARVNQNIKEILPHNREKPPLKTSDVLSGMSKTTDASVKEVSNELQFTLKTIEIGGSTLYSEASLQDMAKPYIGRPVGLADLKALTQAILARYREDGHYFVRAIIPEQVIERGKVRIDVIESFISKVTITGDVGLAKAYFDTYTDTLITGKSFDYQKVQEVLYLSTALPGIKTRGVLSPSPNIPNGVEFNLLVKQDKNQSFIQYNNRSGPYLGPNQVVAGTIFSNVILGGDQLSLNYAMNPNKEKRLRYGAVNYTKHFTDGKSIEFYWNRSHTRPGLLFENFDYRGISQGFGVVLRMPHKLSFIENGFWGIKLDGMDSKTASQELGLLDSDNNTRSIRLGYWYNTQNNQLVNNAYVQVSQGINGLGATKRFSETTENFRPGKLEYTKIEAEWTQTYFIDDYFSIKWSAFGQYAVNSLISTEKIAFGGAQYGRGYESSDILGDLGAMGYIEFRIDTFPEVPYIKNVQSYCFYDYGVMSSRNDSGAGRLSGASAGIGSRLYSFKFPFGGRFIGQAEFVKPLTRPISSEGHKKPTMYFSGTLHF